MVVPLAVLFLLAVLGGAAVAYQNGLIPGFNQPEPEAPVVALPQTTYLVAAPDQLLGWQRSTAAKAQGIVAVYRDTDTFPEAAVTTFVYVTPKDTPALYGAVYAQQLSKAEQRTYLSDTARALRRAAPGGALGGFTDRPAGELGGVLRCATLRGEPASTTCIFTAKDASGVLTIVGQNGKPAVEEASAARAALITSR